MAKKPLIEMIAWERIGFGVAYPEGVRREMSTETFSVEIRKVRELLGMTQEQFAKQVGVAYATVNRWERGWSKPSPLAWRQLTKLLAKEAQRVAGKKAPRKKEKE
jgi:DNA-binding transcriptional regulator YiaG